MAYKKIRQKLKQASRSQRLVAGVVVVLVGIAGVLTLLFSHASTPNVQLYLAPASQTVTNQSNVVVSVMLNTDGASINTVQSVVSYDPAKFSFVGITPGPAFTAPDSSYIQDFTYTTSTGSVRFTAAPPASSNNIPVTPAIGIQDVVTITLKAIGNTGATPSAITLNNSLCGPPNNFTSTCTAAYDASTSGNPNDLLGSTTPIINGSYTINPVLPSVPTGLSGTPASTTSINLRWNASTDTGGPGVGGYNLYRDGTLIASPTGTTYTDTVAIGSSHSYTVAAFDTSTPANASAQSSAVNASAVNLSTPTGVAKTASTAKSISLSWSPSTDNAGTVAGYNVFRNGTQVGTSSGTSYTDSGLAPSMSYSYTVQAFDNATPANLSAKSTAASFAAKSLPTTPTGLQSTVTTTSSVTLTWNASTDSTGTLSGYNIYRNGTLVASPKGATTYTDSGLASGTSYSYTIAAFDTDGNASATTTTGVSASTLVIPGDLDSDGHVTGHDLSIFLAHYGTNYPLAEFDGGSTVEGHDLSILLSNYGD